MNSNFMEFDFGNLHYLHFSSDKKNTILFLHSLNSSAASFLRICDLLKDHFNLFCLDFPGHGLSEHVDVNKYSQYYSFAGLTEIVVEFSDRLKLRNLYISGNSMGGNAAVRAIPSLKELQGLILMGSIQSETKEKAFNIMYPEAPTEFLFKKELNNEEIEILTKAYVNESRKKEASYKQMFFDIEHTDINFREQFGHSIETQDWGDEPKLIKDSDLPLLYVLGLQDNFINSKNYKKILMDRGLKEDQIQLLDQVGHVPHLNNPQLCAKLVLEFIRSTG